MKTMTRILIILLAALTVVGATWAVGQSSSNSSTTTFVRGERAEFGGTEGRPVGPEGREGFDRDGSQLLSVRGWLGFAETLVPIALIITVVALPTSLWKRRQRAQRQAGAAASA